MMEAADRIDPMGIKISVLRCKSDTQSTWLLGLPHGRKPWRITNLILTLPATCGPSFAGPDGCLLSLK
jgi:hypothetical protein